MLSFKPPNRCYDSLTKAIHHVFNKDLVSIIYEELSELNGKKKKKKAIQLDKGKRLKRQFTAQDMQIVNKHVKMFNFISH